jgi:hypothetical protein
MNTVPPKGLSAHDTNLYNDPVKVAQNNGLGGQEDSLS